MAKSTKRPLQSEGGSRKRAKSSANADEESLLDTEAGVNRAFSHMDNLLLTDFLVQRTARFGTDLSSVELSDLALSANCITDTTSWQGGRALGELPNFLEHFADKPETLNSAPKQCGAPHTLIVAGAGLRSADIVRAVRKFQNKDNVVAKLFAKHMKIEDQIKFLEKCRTGIAVGTPTRLSDLVENGVLSVKQLQRIVVDASHIDQKKRGITDMKETMMPLMRLLTRAEFSERYMDGERRLALLFY